MPDYCEICTRPIATAEDWDFYDEGEGHHLCWNPRDGACSPPEGASWMDRALAAEARLAAKEEELREAVAGPPGPYEHCTTCGRRMVWDYKERELPIWMCPRCVFLRAERAEEECGRLRGFVNAALDDLYDYGWGDLDGLWLQETMEKWGILETHEMDGPCRTQEELEATEINICPCMEYGFPTTCYRPAPFMGRGDQALAAEGEGEEE